MNFFSHIVCQQGQAVHRQELNLNLTVNHYKIAKNNASGTPLLVRVGLFECCLKAVVNIFDKFKQNNEEEIIQFFAGYKNGQPCIAAINGNVESSYLDAYRVTNLKPSHLERLISRATEKIEEQYVHEPKNIKPSRGCIKNKKQY